MVIEGKKLPTRAVNRYAVNKRGSFHLKISLTDSFGLAEHQGNATNGLRCKLTMKKKTTIML